MADALEQLKQRLAEVYDLQAVARLLTWDQQTMMPAAGAAIRAEHAGTLRRIAHERFIAGETGRLLDELRSREDSLDPDSDDACLIRISRRDYEKEVRVPTELRAEMARAASQARQVWVEARAKSDFKAFLPALERNVELRRRYVACFENVDEPYDILLDDFEPETKTADVRPIFDEVKAELVPLIAELRDVDVEDGFLTGDFPPDRQEALVKDARSAFTNHRAGCGRTSSDVGVRSGASITRVYSSRSPSSSAASSSSASTARSTECNRR